MLISSWFWDLYMNLIKRHLKLSGLCLRRSERVIVYLVKASEVKQLKA